MIPRNVAVLAGAGFGFALLAITGCKDRNDTARGATEPLRYGALMSEVGRRFELLGRAGAARRWELAAFELHELEEVFEDLPKAKRPETTGGVNLRGIEQAFTGTHPAEIKAALDARDAMAFTTAFGRAAATCNGCHQATGHRFIEIPGEPGAGIPKLDPVP